ncbi:UDP-N-acetylglucosamine transferase subunit ALG13 homolog [Tigriopus californicus]|uniref:UDP-N-acetylglucosamine transferase subunit ALG13 homolog n=1 Tax=Tigriopus californicus TaxID=6832 RepID=UPI0027DA3A5F|nr:UDP-N-acetylglucosamine transferase subunit ALG13 homolog [Tigriopus californicus]|eukprot:TCALIF_07150-PA protein Name:"Similar to Alg13 UDP-N-acetylglucosamine transferase subunit ALG13 homolog (Rattus norvegicus)" AED:0.06 eAED:0.06 QI:52/1/1/1/1/1/2/5506/204
MAIKPSKQNRIPARGRGKRNELDQCIRRSFEVMLGDIFVTVGTTQFQRLIDTLLDSNTLAALQEKGCQKLIIQKGQSVVASSTLESLQRLPFHVEVYDYKPSLREDIAQADLVIAHAGAGTSLEVLEEGRKPLIVVVNEALMDNHQIELAEKLANEGHCHYCHCETLVEVIESFDPSSLRPLTPGQPDLFAQYFQDTLKATFNF